jgi:hypothetical protein
MTEIPKKNTPARFEQTSEAMPRLSAERSAAETVAPGAEPAAAPGHADVRSIRVPKLDRQTVWRVIDMLKSL